MNVPSWLALIVEAYGIYFAAGVLFFAALIARELRRDRRRQAIARQNAEHPHPSVRWLTPSGDPFDRTRPNRYTVPAQRRQL